MPESDLRKTLEQLQAEIENTETDAEKQQVLADIKARVDKALEDDAEAENNQGLLDQLRESYVHFEVEHPALSRAMEITINSLSNLGI